MNILIINGNTQKESLAASVCSAYKEGAQQAGHQISVLSVGDLTFDPILHEGYHSIQDLEPDLLDFQEKILWANHIVIIYPTWWGGMPAILKGLFDRSFLPGFAFKYHDKGPFWDKLLKGKSAHILTTMDAPKLWYWLVHRSAGTNMLKYPILKFCGISPVKTTLIDRVKNKSKDQLEKEIYKVRSNAARL